MEPRVTRSSTVTEVTPTEPVPVVATGFAPPAAQVPVAPMVPVETVPVETVGAAVPVAHEHVVVDTRRTISASAVVGSIAGLALMLWGAVAVARAGLGGDLRTPIVEVTGWTATAVLGLIVLIGGFLLLLAGLARSRGAVVFLSLVMAVAAATLVIEPTTAQGTLAAERDFGVAALIVLGVTALVAILTPDVDRVGRRERIA